MFEGVESTDNFSEDGVMTVHMWGVREKDMKLTPVRSSFGIRPLASFLVDVRLAGHTEGSEGVIAVTELSRQVVPWSSSPISEWVPALNEIVSLGEVKREVFIEAFVSEVFKVRHMPWGLLREELYKELPLGCLNDSATDFQYLRLRGDVERGLLGEGWGRKDQGSDVKGEYE